MWPSFKYHSCVSRSRGYAGAEPCTSEKMIRKSAWHRILATPKTTSATLDVVEVDTNIVVLSLGRHGQIDGSLVDPGRLGKLSVLLQVTRLVGAVLVDDVDLLVLEVALADEDDVTGSHPHLLAHLSADVAQAGHTVEAEALAAAVAKHLDHLGVLLSLLLELELALGLLAVSLSSAAVLASLS